MPGMEYKLNSGHRIAAIGFGTATLTDREPTLRALEAAYETGYRHFDTASFYGNEEIIGEFIGGKDRGEIFITTKLWNTDHDRVEEACAESMKRLGVDYLDLYLVHWPINLNGEFNLEKLWRDMERLVDSGKARSIGVANFGVKNLKKLLCLCRIKPAMNQVELHPYLPQCEIRKFCNENDIQVTSYSSLGSSATEGSVKDEPVIVGMARKHKTSPATVLLSYCIRLGCCVIPRSRSPEHIKSNFKTISLTDEDMKDISSVSTRRRYCTYTDATPSCYE